jgi:hypothetical protein
VVAALTAHVFVVISITDEGDVKVCTTSCYIAINGVGWRNWGVTLKEQAERYAKYLRDGDDPERALPIPSTTSVVLQVTARGR